MFGLGLGALGASMRQGHGHVGSPYTLTANCGVFGVTGIAATLIYSGAVGSTYTLTAGAGTFTLNGVDMAPTVSYLLAAGTGSFVATGIDATLTKSSTGPTLIAHALAGNATAPTTSAINTTGANLLVVAVSAYNGALSGVALTDSKGNTWTPLTAKSGFNEAYNRIFYCASPTVGSGHTFTWDNGGTIFGAIAVQAWSGLNVAPFDTQNGFADTGTSNSAQPGSITPGQNNSLVVTALGTGGTTAAGFSVNGGFTIADSINGQSGIEGLGMAYLVQTTAAAANPTWSYTGGGVDAAVTIAAFKP